MTHARRNNLQMPCQIALPTFSRTANTRISAPFRWRSGKAGKILPVGGRLLPVEFGRWGT
jgi:hypothetical protein